VKWLWSALVLLLGRGLPRRAEEEEPSPPDARPERLAIAAFLAAALCAAAFPVVYGVESIRHKTQFLGLSLGLALLFLAVACYGLGKSLHEESEEPYPPPDHEAEQEEIEQLVAESGERFTRKRLLIASGGTAGAALAVALVTPAASLGPALRMAPFYRTPWRRGRRLVDEHGRVLRADEVEEETFYTAFPEGADPEDLGSPLVVVRLDPVQIRERRDWAPEGIVAYSKICTHAGCAIALYRKPTFPSVQPRPALVCPCHYSTFDPARAGKVLFGPAGRPLPQLPLELGANGELSAAGNFSAPVGPSWWGVHLRKPSP
jgi:ubiquinol-cytochrome c reductase iron-sulfur subunit